MAARARRFFACYLLTPVQPPHRMRCTYVGFTVSPTRRIRQHNGELVQGAKRTSKYRPWEMVVVVHGFASKHQALQFEFAWQHPYSYRLTREHMAALKGRKGFGSPHSLKRKLLELHKLVHLSPWTEEPLVISYTSDAMRLVAQCAGHDACPPHIVCETRSLSDFASYCAASDEIATCGICEDALREAHEAEMRCYHDGCGMRFHSLCLSDHFVLDAAIRADIAPTVILPLHRNAADAQPTTAQCPGCEQELRWSQLEKHPSASPGSGRMDIDSERSDNEDANRNAADASIQQHERSWNSASSPSQDEYEYQWFEDDDDDDVDTAWSPGASDSIGNVDSANAEIIDLTGDDDDI